MASVKLLTLVVQLRKCISPASLLLLSQLSFLQALSLLVLAAVGAINVTTVVTLLEQLAGVSLDWTLLESAMRVHTTLVFGLCAKKSTSLVNNA